MLKKIITVMLLIFAGQAIAQSGFVISDIRIEGLQRIPAAVVFSNLPFTINERMDATKTRAGIRDLFKTGNFSDVQIGREDDVLVIQIVERPSIGEIEIEGNKAIKTDDLLRGLAQAKLSEGDVLKRATLESIRLELERQYVLQGRYDAEIITEIEPLTRNRVALKIDIYEGKVAKIKHLNVVGSSHFEQQELIELFEMKRTGTWSWLRGNDKYSRERFSGDLERLESFYRDQGYLNFEVDSTQVSLSPERDAVFVTVNVTEGEVYNISEIKLSGEIILEEKTLRQLILLKVGDVYAQNRVIGTEQVINRVLGADGYTFANVRHYLKVNKDDNTVELTFFINPGKQIYINRIIIQGNSGTSDEVIRREIRVMEGGLASGPKLDQSKVRLERLGFFASVQSDIEPVPGSDDLIDVTYTVAEQPSGSIGASVGYSDSGGVIFSANIEQKNFLGTGNNVGFSVSRNKITTSYNFHYTNPYYTIDGVSRGFSVFSRETNFDKLRGVASFGTNTYGGNLSYSYPISETARLGFGFGYANIDIRAGTGSPQEILETPTPIGRKGTGFLDRNGSEFDSFTLTAFWRESKLNRGFMPTNGWSQSLSLEAGIPETDLEYFKLTYRGQYLWEFAPELSWRFHTRLGYGDGYGDLTELPFFENYFAGGFGSIRGFERSTLGPQGSKAKFRSPLTGQILTVNQSSDTIGGDTLVESGIELIFPLWFIKNRRSLRTVLFVDAGNVFDSRGCSNGQLNCSRLNPSELRASYGFGLTWVSALGPLTFSVARPINESSEDRTKFFQFSIGTGF